MRASTFIQLIIFAITLLGFANSQLQAKEMSKLHRLGAKVEISGVSSGSVYAAGAEVDFDGSTSGNGRLMGVIVCFAGRVGGDLWAIGANLAISGEITNDLRAWGAKILLNSFVGGRASLKGADIVIDENAAISKKTHATGDKVVFKGAAIGRVELEGREVVFAGSARSGLRIRAPSVKITENARIIGNVTIHTIGTPEISPAAQISGTVTVKKLPRWEVMRRSHEGGLINRIAPAVFATLCAFLAGILAIALARNGVETAIDTLVEQPMRSGLWGLIGLITIMVSAAFLILTILGAPLAAAILMSLPLILLLSLTGSGFAIGEWLFNRTGDDVSTMHRALSLLVGLLLLAALSIMPYIGELIIALAIVFGAGALFLLFNDRFGMGAR